MSVRQLITPAPHHGAAVQEMVRGRLRLNMPTVTLERIRKRLAHPDQEGSRAV